MTYSFYQKCSDKASKWGIERESVFPGGRAWSVRARLSTTEINCLNTLVFSPNCLSLKHTMVMLQKKYCFAWGWHNFGSDRRCINENVGPCLNVNILSIKCGKHSEIYVSHQQDNSSFIHEIIVIFWLFLVSNFLLVQHYYHFLLL